LPQIKGAQPRKPRAVGKSAYATESGIKKTLQGSASVQGLYPTNFSKLGSNFEIDEQAMPYAEKEQERRLLNTLSKKNLKVRNY
jgi:hypothetical protein